MGCSAGIVPPAEITKEDLERYQSHLFHWKELNGSPLALRTQSVRLTRLRGFFRWLAREGHVAANPAADLELPRTERRLPFDILSAAEAEIVLDGPDLTTPLGLRDRTILELFYAAAIRRSELVKLKLADIDLGRAVLTVRQGKGKKDRVAPIGARAKGLA